MKFKNAVLLNPCVESELWTDGTINKMIVLVHLMNVLMAASDLLIFVLKKFRLIVTLDGVYRNLTYELS